MNIEKILTSILTNTSDSLLELSSKELGLHAEYRLEKDRLHLDLSAGFPTKTLKSTLLPALQKAFEQALPNYQIEISLEQLIRSHRTQLVGKNLRNVKNILAVASGKGGVGKSTVAVNLAIALARAGASVGILDADIYGPSIPVMLGKTLPVEISENHYLPVYAHGIEAMSIGYLTDYQQALIWRGPMLAKSLIQMLDATRWSPLDYLIIDLPPGTGDIQLSLVQKIPLTGAIIVTTPQNIATLDAQKAITMFRKTNIDVVGLIENMSLHFCSQCGHQEAIFGSGGAEHLSDRFEVKILGHLPLDSRIRSQCDAGYPTAARVDETLADSFMQTAMRIAVALAGKPLNYADKFPDIVVE